MSRSMLRLAQGALDRTAADPLDRCLPQPGYNLRRTVVAAGSAVLLSLAPQTPEGIVAKGSRLPLKPANCEDVDSRWRVRAVQGVRL